MTELEQSTRRIKELELRLEIAVQILTGVPNDQDFEGEGIDGERIDWLEAEFSRLEDVLGWMKNEPAFSVRGAIDHFRKEEFHG